MAIQTRSEGVGSQMALPSEVTTVIANIVKQRPSNDVAAIVSEVIETLAGKDPDKILAWIKNAGGTSGFVQEIQAETRRLKSTSA